MSEYLVSVVAASVLGVVSDIICTSYGTGSKAVEKFVKLAVTICMLGLIILPAMKSDILLDLQDITEVSYTAVNENVSDSLYMLEYECEQKTSEYIFTKTGIKPVRVIIDMKSDGEVLAVEKAEIVLERKYEEKSSAISDAATEALGVKVNVLYEQ